MHVNITEKTARVHADLSGGDSPSITVAGTSVYVPTYEDLRNLHSCLDLLFGRSDS